MLVFGEYNKCKLVFFIFCALFMCNEVNTFKTNYACSRCRLRPSLRNTKKEYNLVLILGLTFASISWYIDEWY